MAEIFDFDDCKKDKFIDYLIQQAEVERIDKMHEILDTFPEDGTLYTRMAYVAKELDNRMKKLSILSYEEQFERYMGDVSVWMSILTCLVNILPKPEMYETFDKVQKPFREIYVEHIHPILEQIQVEEDDDTIYNLIDELGELSRCLLLYTFKEIPE